MKLTRILAASVITVFLASSAAFAAADTAIPTNSGKSGQEASIKQTNHEDPLKRLNGKKEKIQQKLKNGEISKEKADSINAKIDSKIKKIQEFNSLPLQQKKDKLNSNFKAAIDKRVSEGKLDKAKAEELIKKHEEKVKNWDGKGYPEFFKKKFKGHKKHSPDDRD